MMRKVLLLIGFFIVASTFTVTSKVFAHCDTMDGPVIKDAQAALEKGNAMPVLKWVKKEREAEVLQAFDEALAGRKRNPDLKDKTDMEFFKTLVRIHREGEGEHFEGIKPTGTPLEPGVIAADEAIKNGSADQLVSEITNGVSQEIRERFNRVAETKKHMDESIDAGREYVEEYVEAYVEFVHYVEGLHNSVSGVVDHHREQ